MKATDWFTTRSVHPVAALGTAGELGTSVPPTRPMHERLKATLRRHQEALSPRVLRRTLTELKAIVDPQVSEVEAGAAPKASRGGTRKPHPKNAAIAGCS